MEDEKVIKEGHIVLVHGFNVKDDGDSTINRLEQYVDKRNVLQGDYGYFGLWGVRFFNKSIAKTIAGMTPPHSIGVGHSNGCAILTRAAEYGAKFDRLILINPALEKDRQFAPHLKRIDIFHNLSDTTVSVSKWLPFHVWGEMGRTGYQGNDQRVFNHETGELFGATGHSGVFDYSEQLANYIKDNLVE